MNNDSSSHDQDLIDILRELQSRRAEYPPELLASRRASFMEQVAARVAQTGQGDELTPQQEQVVQHIKRLRSMEPEYPPILMASRRSSLRDRARGLRPQPVWMRWMAALRAALARTDAPPSRSFMDLAETAVIMVGLALFAFLGLSFLAQGPQPATFANAAESPVPPEVILSTVTSETVTICKNGYEPPLCLAREFDNSYDATYPGNGSARPAVAKDTLPGHEEVFQAAYVNDGLYGPGASWVSNSPNSWIKIDLGKSTPINTVTFGRDRLGELNDRDPGQFTISVAKIDNVYANGNSSDDDVEYVEVFNSELAGFDGVISGAETIVAQFDLLEARYLKITFERAGTAIDEVEAFVARPPMVVAVPTRPPREPGSNPSAPTNSPTPLPTFTSIPTDTPLPTNTPTPIPTDTPAPTDTPIPTDTPVPLPTETLFPFETEEPYSTISAPPTDSIDLFVD